LQTQQQQSSTGSATGNNHVTSLSDIIDDIDEPYPQERKRPPRKTPIPDVMPAPHYREESADTYQSPTVTRKKVKHATRQLDLNYPTDQYKPDVGISSIRHNPPKGVGHQKMAYSSLKDIPSSNEEYDQSDNEEEDINVMGGEILDDDLDSILGDDPSIDPQIKKGIKSVQGVDKKEAMDSVKKVAMEMQRLRENED
jgi:hypothetical protein